MRSIQTALCLAALCSPAIGQDCRFFNVAGQSIDYRPTDGVLTFDPLYDDRVRCAFLGKADGNGYSLACDDGPSVVVVGASEPDKAFADILVLDNVFFWLKCEETT